MPTDIFGDANISQEFNQHVEAHRTAIRQEQARQYQILYQQYYNAYMNMEPMVLSTTGWQKYESKPKAKKESKIPWL